MTYTIAARILVCAFRGNLNTSSPTDSGSAVIGLTLTTVLLILPVMFFVKLAASVGAVS